MTRPRELGLDSILAGSHQTTYTARVLSDWDREIIPNLELPLSAGNLRFDMTAQVCGSGSATITLADVWGRSFNPTRVTDFLAPYGNWLEVTCHVRAGRYHSPTVLGRFEISNPQLVETGRVVVGGLERTTAESIKVKLDDAFLGTSRETITSVQQAPVGRSVRDELADLLGLPVRTDIDAEIGSLVEYPEDRLKAAFDLAQMIDGTPFMQWDNTVGIRPIEWPEPSGSVLRDGPDGLIAAATVSEWDSTSVKNRVEVSTEDDAQVTLIAVRQIQEGPLRYGPRSTGAWGRYPRVYKSAFFTDQDQVDAYADRLLATVSQPRAVGVSFSMPTDPTLEVGDVRTLETSVVSGTIRVKTISLDISSSTMEVTAYLPSETGTYDGDDIGGRGWVLLAQPDDEGRPKRVSLRIVGSYPPIVGDRVRLTVAGADTVIDGVAAPKPTRGNVTSVGVIADGSGAYVPCATVRLTDGTDVGGVRYLDHIANLRAGDAVVIDWPAGGLIIGRFPAIKSDPVKDNGGGRVTQLIRAAAWAGRYYQGSATSGGPACTTNNTAVWGGYGLAASDLTRVTRIEMKLPVDNAAGGLNYSAARIGTHSAATQPSTTPTAGGLAQMVERSGWVAIRDDAAGLNAGWGAGLASGGGVIIPARNGTEDYWLPLSADPESGSLKLIMRS